MLNRNDNLFVSDFDLMMEKKKAERKRSMSRRKKEVGNWGAGVSLDFTHLTFFTGTRPYFRLTMQCAITLVCCYSKNLLSPRVQGKIDQ